MKTLKEMHMLVAVKYYGTFFHKKHVKVEYS